MSVRVFMASLAVLFVTTSTTFAQGNAIVERMNAFVQAYNAGDAETIAKFYLERGALLPPQSKVLVGREPIAAHYTRAFQNGVGDLKYRIIEIDQVGPSAAVEIAETQVKIGGKTILGRSLHVWKKIDQTWWLARDMYHVLGVEKN